MAFTGYSYDTGLAMLGQGVNAVRKRWDEQAAAEAQALGFDQWAAAQAPQSLAALGQPAPAAASSAPQLPSMARGDAIGQYAQAIQGNESGGKYDIVGPTHPKLGRALGAYQVMEANVAPWTKEALGRSLTPEEFLRDPAAQDAVFRTKFGQAVEKYGNPQDAASVWFTGRPLAQGANARDVLGTTGQGYVDKFTAGLNRQGTPATFAEAVPGSQSPAPLPPARGDGGVQVASADPSFVPQQMPTPRGGAVSPSEILVNQAQARQGSPAAQPMQLAQNTPAAAGGAPGAISDQQKQVIRGLLANPDTKAMGMALWQQALKPGEIKLHDLGDAVGVIDARGNLLRTIPKTRAMMSVGAEQGIFDPNTGRFLVEPQAKPHTTNVKPGEAVVDQNTGQVVYQAPAERAGMFDGKSVEGQSLNHLVETGKLTREQAAEFGAGKTITGPDGSILFATPSGMIGRLPGGAAPAASTAPAAPGAGASPSPVAPGSSGMIPLTGPREKEPNEGQANAAAYATRMEEADKILSRPEATAALRSRVQRGLEAAPGGVGHGLTSTPYQLAENAQRTFINAILRRESGAAVSPAEFENYGKQYFPLPGDGPEVIAQKAQDRRLAIDGLKTAAGSALKARSAGEQQPGQPKVAPPASVPEGATATNPKTGEQIIRRNGQWVPLT